MGVIALGWRLDEELKGRASVIVTTYQSASSRLAGIEAGSFDMLILDEAHKLRNLHGGNKPPRMAESVRSALERRLFKFVVMLTATPIQNRLWDSVLAHRLPYRGQGTQEPPGNATRI